MSHDPTDKRGGFFSRGRVEVLAITGFAFGVTLLLTSVRVPAVDVVLVLEVDELGFELREDWEVFDLGMSELSVANAGRIDVEGGATISGPVEPDSGPRRAEALVGLPGATAWQTWFSSDYLRLNLAVSGGSEARLRVAEAERRTVQVTVAGSSSVATLDTGRELAVRCVSCVSEPDGLGLSTASGGAPYTFRPARRSVRVSTEVAPLMLTVKLGEGEEEIHLAPAAGLAARLVDFQRTGSGPVTSAVSGPGEILFPRLDTDPVPIFEREFLQVTPDSDLTLQRVSLIDGTIQVDIRGRVRALKTGPGGALRSQMPTLFEYIASNKWLQGLLGAALTVAAMITGVLGRLRLLSRG